VKVRSGALVRVCRGVLLAVVVAGGLQVVATMLGGVPAVAAQPAQRDLLDTIRGDARFSTLARAVEVAGLSDTLKAPGPYTFFAPTNDAFNKLAPGTVDGLLKDPENLRRVLLSHVSPGYVTAAQAVQVPTLPDTQGRAITVGANGATVTMNGARVTEPDLRASNGVIHVIDTVWVNAGASPRALPTAGEAAGSTPLVALTGVLLLASGLLVFRGRARATRPN